MMRPTVNKLDTKAHLKSGVNNTYSLFLGPKLIIKSNSKEFIVKYLKLLKVTLVSVLAILLVDGCAHHYNRMGGSPAKYKRQIR